MEQISSREVIRVFEKRFRQRLFKARINPELVEPTAQYLRRLRFLKRLAEKGAEFYLRADEGEEWGLPIEGRYVKFLGVVNSFLRYFCIWRVSDEAFLDTSFKLKNKSLCLYAGKALPPFFPSIPDGEEFLTMEAKEFEKILSRVRRYCRLLSENGVKVEPPQTLPKEVEHVVFSKRYTYPSSQYKSFEWRDYYLFTIYEMFRPMTEEERKKVEESRRKEEERRTMEKIIERSKLLFSYDGSDLYEVDPAQLNLGEVAEKTYLINYRLLYSYFSPRSPGLSTPLNFLVAYSALSERGASPTIYVRERFAPEEVRQLLPKKVLKTDAFDDYAALIVPKHSHRLPKPKLAKPIITRKRLILVNP